jgi:hypothetical protein
MSDGSEVAGPAGHQGPAGAATSRDLSLSRLHDALGGGGGAKLFGISPMGNKSGVAGVAELEETIGDHVDIVNVFVGLREPFPAASVAQIDALGAIPELTWEPYSFGQGATQPEYALQRVLDGDFDAHIRKVAAAAAGFGAPLLLRFAHEMNGRWYPWSDGVNGNSAGQYPRTWRHVFDIFHGQGAGNVLWVWCPNIAYPGSTPMRSLYPGDDCVHVVGLDGYNRGSTGRNVWTPPDRLFAASIAEIDRFAGGKPILLNETASHDVGGSKADWIRQLFSYLRGNDRLIGLVWFNYQQQCNWPLTDPPALVPAVRAALADLRSGPPCRRTWRDRLRGGPTPVR